ncbi:hypothetical protein ACFL96_20105, partial [Thermoproteota archaeon]
PFFMNEKNKLCLRFRPILSGELFTRKKHKLTIGNAKDLAIDKNSYAFIFLGTTLVVYHNPKRRNTYGRNCVSVQKITLEDAKGRKHELDSCIINQDYASDVRSGKFCRIDLHLS